VKRLCIISGFFPPVGGSGVQRVYKHTKYLKEFGWDCVVITRATPYYFVFDESLIEELPPGLEVYRTFSLDYGFLKRLFGKQRDKIVEDRRWDPAEIRKLKLSNLIRLFFLVPDGLIGWIPFAFLRALRLRKRVDAYYLRMPPWSTGYLAPLLKIFTKKPVLADYSDEWTTDNIEFIIRPHFRQWMERCAEKIMIWGTKWVSFSTESSKRLYEEKYPEYAYKFRVILNGYDEEDFKAIEPLPRNNEKLILSQVGSLEDRIEPRGYTTSLVSFFLALRALNDEYPALEHNLEVRFVGFLGERSKKMITELGLERVIKICGYKAHREALRELVTSDALLLILFSKGNGPRVIAGKLFEYLRARKPILALAPEEGESARLIKLYNAGVVVPPDDIQLIKEKLLEFIRLKKEGGLSKWEFSSEPLERLSRRNSTKTLVQILEECVSGGTNRNSFCTGVFGGN